MSGFSKPYTRTIPPQMAQSSGIQAIMLDVIVALLPSLGMAVFLFGPRVLLLTAVSVGACVAFEYLYRRLRGMSNTVGDLSACVTGLLLAMCLPVSASYWAPLLGGLFAIVVVKQFYGGLGKNFMNPALAGRMLLTTFPLLMTSWTQALNWVDVVDPVDAVSAATPMSYLHQGALPPFNMGQLLMGQHGGAMGSVSVFMLMLGGLYLVMRRVISPRIPLSFLGTVAVLTFLFPRGGAGHLDWTLAQLSSGGLMLGAIFMATDYTTSPVTPKGQIYFGVGCGLLTVLLRYFGSYPDGVGWAILTMNCCVWLLDRAGMPRRFGEGRFHGLRHAVAGARESLAEIKFVKPQLHLHLLNKKGEMLGEAHLDQIRTQGKAAGVLAAAILITACGVTGVHYLTDLDIVRAETKQQQALLAQVMPQADIRTETPYRSPNAQSITAGYRDNELVGYCVEVQTQGFGGPMTVLVGVDTNGEVTGVAVTDHKETLEMGTRAMEEGYLSRYVGKSGTIRSSGSNAVAAVSGATETSKAITACVNQALSIVANLDTEGDVNYVDSEV